MEGNYWINLLMQILLALLAGGFVIGGAWFSSRAAVRRVLSENRKDDSETDLNKANAVKTLQETINAQAKAADELRQDMSALRDEVESLRKEVDERDKQLQARDHLIRDYQDWIVRLIHQVKSLGPYEPVPFRSSYPDVDQDAGNILKPGA
jgi:peptidoglycan hydrolase CwlO-like protein